MNSQYLPSNLDGIFKQAIVLQENGRIAEAESIYKQILALSPTHIGAKTMLGMAYVQSERNLEGIKLLKASLAKDPKQFWAQNALGVALLNTKQYQEAKIAFNKALLIKPDFIDAHFNLGKTLRALKQYEHALVSYSKCLELNKNFANAYNNIGTIYLEDLKEYNTAFSNFEQYLRFQPNSFLGHYNLGTALKELSRFDEALQSFQTAIRIKPDFADAHYNQGIVLDKLGCPQQAIASYEQAIKIKPDYAEAYNNLGAAFSQLKFTEDALQNYKLAIQFKPDYAEAYFNQGVALSELKYFEQAVSSYEYASSLQPEMDYLWCNLLHTKMHMCDWDNFDELSQRLINNVAKNKLASTPFIVLSITDDPNIHCQSAISYVHHKHPTNNRFPKIDYYKNHKKIRLGYFSGDFHFHPVSHLAAELFEQHDRNQFEIIAFSFDASNQDAMRIRLEKAFDQFIDVSEMTDLEIVTLARKMEIDIAVDLGGFTAGGRANIFAMQASPIQVNYLGYPGTMSADYIDYMIADKTLIPEELTSYYSEKIAYLPNSHMVNDSTLKPSEDTINKLSTGLPEDAFIFACFNASYKITPSTFSGWMRIMRAIDHSILWIADTNETAKRNLRQKAKELGINENRIIFAPRTPTVSDHLNRIKLADLFLDTFPYNAMTTSNDSLKAGLPVLTLMGKSFVSRVSASLLKTLELDELITTTQDEYESKAIELAKNPEKLNAIKRKLISNLEISPFSNTPLFAKHIEKLYQTMYQRHINGLEPDHIVI